MDLSNLRASFRGSKTLSGISFDLAKSALQKYIRRGDAAQAMKMGVEMDAFRMIEGGEACWTNFYNRLRICYLEDIGLADIEMLLSVDWRLEEWKNSGNSDDGKMFMLTLIRDMAFSVHSRYFSHLRYVCCTFPPDAETPVYIHDLKEDCKIPFLRENVNGLVWCLEENDRAEKAWYFAEEILKVEKLEVRRYGGFRSGFLVFEIIEHFLPETHRKHFNVCVKWYKTMKMKEQFLCCMFMLEILNMRMTPRPMIIFEEPISSYQPFGNDVVAEFAADMHTLEGKRAGRGTTEFAIDGSMVSLDVRLSTKFQQLYTQSKIVPSLILKESEEFTLKGRAQLICSGSRPDTYFAKTRTGRDVVVKGPFRDYENACQAFHLQAMMKRYTRVNTLDVNIKYLYPDMFRSGENQTTLGCRMGIQSTKPAYFLVMNDLIGLQVYPLKMKESKNWNPTPVVDFEKVFEENKEMGFGFAEEMPPDAAFSFAIQLTFRYIFKLGDFAARNFLRVGDKVWNLDVERIGVGNTIRLSKKNKDILLASIIEHEEEFCRILKEWSIENMISRGGEESEEIMRVLKKFSVMF